ncbi:MAG: Flp pilus assembly complex ATPase component TadA [Nitrospinae bacterium]|nr:Flp pilus assembly complex ATPase component TadA [Nitrospinota bacterium]
MAEVTSNVPDNQKKRKPLGQRLLEAGLISKAQLELALREQKRLGIYLGDALESLGFVSQDVIASLLAQETEAAVVDVKTAVIEQDALSLIPYELAKKYKIIPLALDGETLTVAMVDTLNVVAVDAAEQSSGKMVDVVTAGEQAILEAIEHHYAQSGSIEETMDQILNKGAETLGEDAGEEAPMIRLMDQIIALAVKNRATDIHIEPDEKIVRIRMRVDGVLTQQVLMPKPLQSALTARLKIMANLNVTEKRVPQDGRITFQLGLRRIDLRVSTLPTVYGENLVIRVLDKGSLSLTLPALGFGKKDEESFTHVLGHPHGIILVTGPTGSGKTSTLYAALSMVNTTERSVFTLEDPIEYQLPVIRQTQVRADIGMSFATGLRALLRQDPDVIMVGEIRDAETAELAVRAALTGHLVFSTLHTNDAAGAIPRLVDMGIEPYLLTSALACVVGQRLVRRICDECKEEEPNPEKILAGLELNVKAPEGRPLKLWRGVGCKNCNGNGYRGRLGIYEIMKMEDTLHDAVLRNAAPSEIKRLARDSGFRTMLEDGVIKALAGVTTIKEVMRVIK